jgi:hypothetical protein
MLSALRMRATSDATVAELRAWAEAEHGARVSHQVMWKVLTRLGRLSVLRLLSGNRLRPSVGRNGREADLRWPEAAG